MRIIITSIEPTIIDTSTVESEDFIIAEYIIRYDICFPPRKQTHVIGALRVEVVDNMVIDSKAIIKYLKDLYKPVEDKLNAEPFTFKK